MPQWLELILIGVLVFIVAAVLTAVLCGTVIFPIVNKLFKTKLPVFNFEREKEEIAEAEPEKKEEPHTAKPPPQKSTAPRAKPEAVRYVDVHKDVPTVKLPSVQSGIKDTTLTISKIDAAAKNAHLINLPSATQSQPQKRESNPIQKIEKAQSPKINPPANKNVDDAIQTFEIPIVPAPVKEQKMPKSKAKVTDSTEKAASETKSVKSEKKTDGTEKSAGGLKTVKATEETKVSVVKDSGETKLAKTVKKPDEIKTTKTVKKAEETKTAAKKKGNE